MKICLGIHCKITFEVKVTLLTDHNPYFCIHFAFSGWIYIRMCVATFPTTNQTCTKQWMVDSFGIYSLHSTYTHLHNIIIDSQQSDIFVEIWKLKVPPKVQHFIWRQCLDGIPIKSNLRKRNIHMHDQNALCCFCHLMEKMWRIFYFSHARQLERFGTLVTAG